MRENIYWAARIIIYTDDSGVMYLSSKPAPHLTSVTMFINRRSNWTLTELLTLSFRISCEMRIGRSALN